MIKDSPNFLLFCFELTIKEISYPFFRNGSGSPAEARLKLFKMEFWEELKDFHLLQYLSL
jgi:hypothetical protein